MTKRLSRGGISVGLLGRIILILIAVMATEFVTNTYLFDRASQFALHEDEVERIAEHLVVAHRLMDQAGPDERPELASQLCTDRFAVRWSPGGPPPAPSFELDMLRNQIFDSQPELAMTGLSLHLRALPKGGTIEGTMGLSDGSRLFFHTTQGRSLWSLTYSRIVGLLAPTLVLVVLGGLLIRHTLRPLSVLIRETGRVGTDEHRPVPEAGPTEIRRLIHAFNEMQQRIHRLLGSRTQALAAVGHDLRTPLARMRLRLENVAMDDRTRDAMERDMEEMNDLLRSLQVYLSGEGRDLPRERIDLAAMAMTLIDTARDEGKDARYSGPETLEMVVQPVAVRRALANLIDNALHYGGNVRLGLRRVTGVGQGGEQDDWAEIVIEDDGPGIAEEHREQVLQPFVRLDDARSRNTRGMGLGLAIVADAVRMEGGTLTLTNHRDDEDGKDGSGESGGLRVLIRLPIRDEEPSSGRS